MQTVATSLIVLATLTNAYPGRRDIAQAGAEPDVTITSSTSTVVAARTSSSKQRKVPRVTRVSGGYAFGAALGVAQVVVPGGFDIVDEAPGRDQGVVGAGPSVEFLLRIPFADLRFGLGTRILLGGFREESWAQLYPDHDFERGIRLAINLSLALPLWVAGNLELHGVGDVSYEIGSVSSGPNAPCLTHDCRPPLIEFSGYGAHGGAGIGHYFRDDDATIVITLEAKAGVVRWFDARTRFFKEEVTFGTTGRFGPSVLINIRIEFWAR